MCESTKTGKKGKEKKMEAESEQEGTTIFCLHLSFSCFSSLANRRNVLSFFPRATDTMIRISSLTFSSAIATFCSHSHDDCNGDAGCRKSVATIST